MILQNSPENAISDLYVYCRFHECKQDDYSKRCRIRSIIQCKADGFLPVFADIKVNNNVLEQGIDFDMAESIQRLSTYCQNTMCTNCTIRKLCGCETKDNNRMPYPKEWKAAYLFNTRVNDSEDL